MNKQTRWFFIGLMLTIVLSSFIFALPAGPVIQYLSNSTAQTVTANRSLDEKGTITVISLSSNQQDFKWKAYVGNVSGKLALDDGTSYTIYDWTLGTPSGEIYVSRSGTITWSNVSCANDSIISTEQSMLGMTDISQDNINRTFEYTAHSTWIVGTTSITNSTCKSTATYVNDTTQTIDETANFQEILLQDSTTGSLIYSTSIEDNALGYNTENFDFQLIVAENESATVPLTYYFYVELS